MRDIIEEEVGGPSVFRDEGKLDFSYVPDDLPHRDDAYRDLARIFKPLLTSGTSQHGLLQGPVGSGKTALSKRFCRDLQRTGKDRDVNLEFVHVNCRRRNTEDAALLQVLQHFDPNFPDRGFSISEKLETLGKRLERKEAHLIVILDEADALLKKSGSDLVYHLTRFAEEQPHLDHSVCVLLVSQQDARRLLDEAAASTFRRTNAVKLDRYDRDALRDIVTQRVELAFHPGTFLEELQELVADISAPEGDARFAIEILHKAGAAADSERSDVVEAEHVRAAKAEVHPHVTETKLLDLDTQRQLTLLAVARVLKAGGAYAITGEVEERYALVCEEFDERPRAHTQFWTYLQDLEAGGFIDTKRSGKGIQGTTTVISLPDVPARELETKLLQILQAR